ncbi:unnamed protein product [Withania somnifera]
MFQRSCIAVFFILTSYLPFAFGIFLNLTLPGQHPDPEAVALEVNRKVNASLSILQSRRKMLSYTSSDQSSCQTGNPIDDCWRCDHNWQLNRQRLADCGIGFGQYALGGKGGLIREEPLWIVFAANMEIKLYEELIFNSYKTLDGRGVNVHITGGGCITLQYISNVIIHNIHVHHCYESGNTNVRSSPTHFGYRGKSDGDGISIFGSRDIWIDHCSLSNCKDGLIDVVMGSTGITISNNHFSHHNEVMLLGHSDDYLPDSGMQVTISFNHFGKKLIQRMPRCRRGYIHVVNNDFTRWEMYAIGGSGSPTINSQGNRYIAPFDPFAKEVTKRVDTEEGQWRNWNWRSEGDVMANGAYFIASGEEVEVKYEKAYSVEPKSANFIDQITMNAGVLIHRGSNSGKWTAATNNDTESAGDDGGGEDLVAISGDSDDYGGDEESGSSTIYSNLSLLFNSLMALLALL